MAAAKDRAQCVVERQRETRGGHAVRRIQRGCELDLAAVDVVGEEAEGRWLRVEAVEAVEEMRVGDKAMLAPADEGGVGE